MRLRQNQPPIAIGPDWDLGLGTLDAEVKAAADLLHRSAIRYQPSFRFQEMLASRLQSAGRANASDMAMAPITMLPIVRPVSADAGLAPGSTEPASGLGAVSGWNRSLLVGGAIASGVSLAGAIVAWRLGRLRPTATGLAAGAQALARSIDERT